MSIIRVVYVKNGESVSSTATAADRVPGILAERPRLLWLDITIENNTLDSEDIALLTDYFKFHELSIEDCLFPQYHPKVEEFESYVFTAVHGVRPSVRDLDDVEDAVYELDLFIGSGFVVTVHTGELPAIDTLFQKAKLKPQVELRNLEFLLYNIFQRVVDTFKTTVDRLDDRFDAVENRVMENPSSELMHEIFSLKKSMLTLRKIADPQRMVYAYFTRRNPGFVSRKSTAYFRDVFYEFDRISQEIAAHNQMISSIIEIYLSGVTLRLNEVMKFLTIIATVLLPALVIASYYGMNLRFPEQALAGHEGLWYYVMGGILIATLSVFLYIKKKKWM